MKRKLTKTDIVEIKAMRLQGHPVRYIASMYGVSKCTVDYHSKKEFAHYRKNKIDSKKIWTEKKTRFSREQIDAMRNMRLAGYSSYKIAALLSVSKDTVLKYTRNQALIMKDRIACNKILFPSYFKGQYGTRNCLTMAELRHLYEMYQADCNIQTISIYMRITREYALECIEAAKWLYEGGLKQLKDHNSIFKSPVRPIEKFFRDDKREDYQRPLAEYTNQRLYDFNKN